ncbi:MAG: NAD(P)-dependent oxidoreductase [Polyangiaceae bacterium]|nr:NAD(P)-dependent oxidoreductase [Polyangiaceae bacterium]
MTATDDRAPLKARLLPDRAETVFGDYKKALARDQAIAEANRCLFCTDAPCVKACPTHIDIPQFIRKIATGNEEGSARTIFSSNILGMTCARVCPVEVLCVGDCVYNAKGEEPIQIGKLQRYATDLAFERGTRFFEAGPDTGKSVGLVGAGPASLAAAHRLRRAGHRVTIYEKRSWIGGLNTTGVAPHKLRADASLEEVEWVLAIGGIEVKTGVAVGHDVTFEELEKRHDALFVGVGLGADTRLGVPNENLGNIEGAVAFIERMKLEKLDLSAHQRCVVVGGGNTALDAVREARTLGIPHVTLLYRGSEAGMSGYAHEWEAAKVEGVVPEWRLQPIAFEAHAIGTAVSGVRCQRLDANKKPIAGAEVTIPADLVLVAIGQATLGELLAALPGVKIEKGRVVTDEHGFTGRKGLYAGGDCRNGGKEVVNAVAEGDAAAQAIDAYLKGSTHG